MVNKNLLTGLLCGVIVINTLLFCSWTEKKGRNISKSPDKYNVAAVSQSDVTIFSLFPVQMKIRDGERIMVNKVLSLQDNFANYKVAQNNE